MKRDGFSAILVVLIVLVLLFIAIAIWVHYYFFNVTPTTVSSASNPISTSTSSVVDETTWKSQTFNGQSYSGPLCYTFQYPASYSVVEKGQGSFITDISSPANTIIIGPWIGAGDLSQVVSGNTYSSASGTILQNVTTTGGLQGEGVFPTDNAWSIYVVMTPSSSQPILQVNPDGQYWNNAFNVSIAEGIAKSISVCK